MKPDNASLYCPVRIAAATVIMVLACLLTGCVVTESIKGKVAPAARIQNVSEKKIPLSVGLMLKPGFCTNSYIFDDNMGDITVFDFGPVLKQQTISLCEQTFAAVVVSTNGIVPAGMDAILTPQIQRYGFSRRKSFFFSILFQWTLCTPDNQNILWMATVDGSTPADWQIREDKARAQAARERKAKGRAAQKPAPNEIITHGGDAMYQHLFNDLANKSYQAFLESPEIKRLTIKEAAPTP
jgi:hypothetical protein